MEITTIGMDIAKRIFQLHGVDERGKAVLKKKTDERSGIGIYGQFAKVSGWNRSLWRS